MAKLRTVVGETVSLPENCQTNWLAKFTTSWPPVVNAFCIVQVPAGAAVPCGNVEAGVGGLEFVRLPRPTAPDLLVNVLDVKVLDELPLLPGPVQVPNKL